MQFETNMIDKVDTETIAAISTPSGKGGIAVIRISGENAIEIADKIWKGRKLSQTDSHTARYGRIVNHDNEVIDEAVALVFKAPNSFTGEDVVELSLHGSQWIQQEVMHLLTDAGARIANRGEFTQRAFINGKIDLAQAESIADLIAADSRAAHKLAITQLKGDYSHKLKHLRENLIDIASLMELELDFSEEDVEFADRTHLLTLANELKEEVDRLASSFRTGRAFKEGIPVVIGGLPNVGKSTLLNALAEDDKAIVTDIPGTTRDLIEERIEIDGILFRITDTAGLRDTQDKVEMIGVEKSRRKFNESKILLWLQDPTQSINEQQTELQAIIPALPSDIAIVKIMTKSDIINTHSDDETIAISALTGEGIDELRNKLVELSKAGLDSGTDIMVTNARHYESLKKASESITRILEGLEASISGDFIAQDIRETMHHLSTITGEITTTTLLTTIFSRFCIGK